MPGRRHKERSTRYVVEISGGLAHSVNWLLTLEERDLERYKDSSEWGAEIFEEEV